MNVESVMSRHVITALMDDHLDDLRRKLAQHHIHHIVIVENRKVAGVVSDRDILANLSPFIGKPSERSADAACLNRRAHQIMTRKLIAATPAMPVNQAATLLLKHGVSCLPVLDDAGGCVGIVTWRDLLRAAYQAPASGAAKAAA